MTNQELQANLDAIKILYANLASVIRSLKPETHDQCVACAATIDECESTHNLGDYANVFAIDVAKKFDE